ncbi:MAG: 1,4-alpha-glucan branching protein domain-containing protein [Thermodesulfovibrionales bacterium]
MLKITSQGPPGFLSIVLHAHLPYVRCPEQAYYLEESWLYEALTETYIPLLRMFEQLLNDRVEFRMTLSLSPTLLAMFSDRLLQERYSRHLDRLIALADEEMTRTRNDSDFFPLARMYHRHFRAIRDLYERVYRRDLIAAFRAVAESGSVELITSAATHAFLPALLSEPSSVRAQLCIGTKYFSETFGRKTGGIWLPECGFAPELDPLIRESGSRFFFLESHGLIAGSPPPRQSIYGPVATTFGTVAFARDVDSAHEVWSSLSGYPGDPDYRDFYRDIGFDHAPEMLRDYLPHGIRTFTGLKYYRITGKSDAKQPYIIDRGISKARIHATDFVRRKKEQVMALRQRFGSDVIKPVITAAYDAELFGHWWFEGVEWLQAVLTQTASAREDLKLMTPSAYIAEHPVTQTCMPSLSSWGKEGYGTTWVNGENNWIYRHVLHASRLMAEMADAASDNPAQHSNSKVIDRALNQAARELLLAQSSDWPFMIKNRSAAAYAEKRLTGHIQNFLSLHREITTGTINSTSLEHLEMRNSLFPNIDYRIFGRKSSDQELVKRV